MVIAAKGNNTIEASVLNKTSIIRILFFEIVSLLDPYSLVLRIHLRMIPQMLPIVLTFTSFLARTNFERSQL